MRRVLTALFLGWAATLSLHAGEPVPSGFLTGFSGDGRLLYFLNHQDAVQEERYVTEGAMTMDFILFSRADRFQVRARFFMLAEMGRSVAENLPFSPEESAYELNPFLEWRDVRRLYRFGLVHACQHLIYKDYEDPWYLEEGVNVAPDVYYNRLSLGVGSREIRPELLREAFRQNGAREKGPSLVWYTEAGRYLRSLGGLLDEEALYGHNDWEADLNADVMIPLRVRRAFTLFAASRTQVLWNTRADTFWRERLELEAFFGSRGFGSSVFLAWNAVDEHPRDRKEGLFELGARFFF